VLAIKVNQHLNKIFDNKQASLIKTDWLLLKTADKLNLVYECAKHFDGIFLVFNQGTTVSLFSVYFK
jgi:hypothetical protein